MLQRYGLLYVREKTRLIKSVWFEKEIFHAHNLNPFVINPTALEIITKDNNLAEMIRDIHQRTLFFLRLFPVLKYKCRLDIHSLRRIIHHKVHLQILP